MFLLTVCSADCVTKGGEALLECVRAFSGSLMWFQVQEAVAASEGFLQMPDAAINMGNLYLALDKPKLAIQVPHAAALIDMCVFPQPPACDLKGVNCQFINSLMAKSCHWNQWRLLNSLRAKWCMYCCQVYSSVLRKSFHGSNATLLLYLGRAYYDAGELKNARTVLLKAVHVAPSDHRLLFNIALTMQVALPSLAALLLAPARQCIYLSASPLVAPTQQQHWYRG